MISSAFSEWNVRPTNENARRALTESLRVHPITAAVLVARGALSGNQARALLFEDTSARPDPYLLMGMEAAVDRIHRAVRQRERVLIYADYDVDGTSAAAIYMRFLRALGMTPGLYIPDRINEGFGLHAEALREIAGDGVSLVLTVDCGTTSFSEIAFAHALGLDVIVTDHHLPEATLPPAHVVINPCCSEDVNSFEGLCSAGLAFTVVRAYAMKYGPGVASLEDDLDLVALATIADLAPLHVENRRMVRQGLHVISEGRRLGLRSLKIVAGVGATCGVGTIGFTLAPRINAAGRLGNAAHAVRLMLSENVDEARALAQLLDQLNRERQQIEEKTVAEAIEALITAEGTTSDATTPIVLASRSWHPGVVGIVASRLVERYHRPTVIIAVNVYGTGRGSARSVAGINICEAIAQCRQGLEGFGGHAAAAGLTIREEAISRFRARLSEVLAEPLRRVAPRQLFCDAEVHASGLTPATVRELDRLGPYGVGNPEPLVMLRRLKVTSVRVMGNKHLKLTLRGSQGPALTALGYGMGTHGEFDGIDHVDLAGSLEINAWNGTEAVQLRIKDVRPSQCGDVISC